MAKTKIILLLLAIILFVGMLLGYRYVIYKPNLDANNIKKLLITALPSPPKGKNVTSKDDIEKFVTFFNTIKLNPTSDQSSKGWEIRILAEGAKMNTIYFVGNKLCFNGVWYSIEDKKIDEMRKLYYSFNYQEESVYNQK